MMFWNDADRDEHDEVLAQAWATGSTDAARTQAFLDLTRTAAADGKQWASELIESATWDGMRRKLIGFHKASFRVDVKRGTETHNVTSIGAVTHKTADGVEFEQKTLDGMTREELLFKVVECRRIVQSAEINEHKYMQAVALIDKAQAEHPDAEIGNARDAARLLRVDFDAYMAGIAS